MSFSVLKKTKRRRFQILQRFEESFRKAPLLVTDWRVGCCLTGDQSYSLGDPGYRAPEFFTATPFSSYVGLLNSQLLAHEDPFKIFLDSSLGKDLQFFSGRYWSTELSNEVINLENYLTASFSFVLGVATVFVLLYHGPPNVYHTWPYTFIPFYLNKWQKKNFFIFFFAGLSTSIPSPEVVAKKETNPEVLKITNSDTHR